MNPSQKLLNQYSVERIGDLYFFEEGIRLLEELQIPRKEALDWIDEEMEYFEHPQFGNELAYGEVYHGKIQTPHGLEHICAKVATVAMELAHTAYLNTNLAKEKSFSIEPMKVYFGTQKNRYESVIVMEYKDAPRMSDVWDLEMFFTRGSSLHKDVIHKLDSIGISTIKDVHCMIASYESLFDKTYGLGEEAGIDLHIDPNTANFLVHGFNDEYEGIFTVFDQWDPGVYE